MSRRLLLLPVPVAALGWHAPALAEISDKVPTLTALWIWVVALTVLAFFAGLWRWWAAAVVICLSLLIAWAGASELLSPDLGPAIARELGDDYVSAAWIAAIAQAGAPALAGLAGWLLRRP